MSAPEDTVLSAEEKAALASLEARAAADDPRLAEHLRGLHLARRFGAAARPDLVSAAAAVGQVWFRLSPLRWGPVMLIAGLGLVVLGLSTSIALSAVGSILVAGGLALVVQHAGRKIEASIAAQPQFRRQDQSD